MIKQFVHKNPTKAIMMAYDWADANDMHITSLKLTYDPATNINTITAKGEHNES